MAAKQHDTAERTGPAVEVSEFRATIPGRACRGSQGRRALRPTGRLGRAWDSYLSPNVSWLAGAGILTVSILVHLFNLMPVPAVIGLAFLSSAPPVLAYARRYCVWFKVGVGGVEAVMRGERTPHERADEPGQQTSPGRRRNRP
jgi:hypothetical protein